MRTCHDSLRNEQTLGSDYVGAAPGEPPSVADPPGSPRGRFSDGIPDRCPVDPRADRVVFAASKSRELESLGIVRPGPAPAPSPRSATNVHVHIGCPGPATAPSPRTPDRRGNTPGERCREAWRLADANPAMTVRELAAVLHVYPSRVKSWLAVRARRGSAA